MADISDLMRELNNLVESRTFTAEAAGGIAKLRERALEAEKRIAALEENLERERRATAKFQAELNEATQTSNSWEMRRADLVKREAAMIELEKKVAVAEAVGKAHDTINQRMLANRIVREDIFHSNQVPIPNYTGSYSTASQTETKQRTVKDEQ